MHTSCYLLACWQRVAGREGPVWFAPQPTHIRSHSDTGLCTEVYQPPGAGAMQMFLILGLEIQLTTKAVRKAFAGGANQYLCGATGASGLPLHNLVSDSSNPHYVSDPLPQSFVGSS